MSVATKVLIGRSTPRRGIRYASGSLAPVRLRCCACRMTRLSRIGALVVALTLAVVGCGGESSSEGASSRCEPLPSAAAEHLGFALSSGTRLVDPVAVRSDDFEHVYMVAARVDGQPAVWAMNQLGG